MTKTNSLTIRYEDLLDVDALSSTQDLFFSYWSNSVVHVLYGTAGTGKTFCALYKALESVLDRNKAEKKVVLIRSAVSTRDIGALPGDIEEKGSIYEVVYEDMCHSMFGKRDAYSRLKEQYRLEFHLSSFLRGVTFDNSIILVDEVQNMAYQELYTIMTRVGENSRILFCGDFKQADIRDSGFGKFMKILERMEEPCFYEFGVNDIVRSDIVKSFIIASEEE